MLFEKIDRLSLKIQTAKRDGIKVLLANGCFDPIRAKHIKMLHLAIAHFGGPDFVKMIVAINGDDSTMRLKGAGRPLFPLQERMAIVDSIKGVDWTTFFDEDDPTGLIMLLQPNVIVKGGDYLPEQVAGHTIVDEVYIIPTTAAWALKAVRPASINELMAASVAATIRAGTELRDSEMLYRDKEE